MCTLLLKSNDKRHEPDFAKGLNSNDNSEATPEQRKRTSLPSIQPSNKRAGEEQEGEGDEVPEMPQTQMGLPPRKSPRRGSIPLSYLKARARRG